MTRWNLGLLSVFCLAAIVGISVTYSAPTRDARLQSKHDNLRLVVDVLEEVQKKYVKDLDQKQMRQLVENMINGGLERLDPHSGYIAGDEFKVFQQHSRGKFGGVGIQLGVDNKGNYFVQSPLAGTPAYNAGVQAGDLLLKVDGKSLENTSLRNVVDLIQGDPGTDVTLTVLHDGAEKPVDLTMKRAEIKVESVMGDQRLKERLDEWDFWIDPATRIGFVRLSAFTETTFDELSKVVEGLQKSGMRGLVIDLRNNPGGLLKSAVEVASLFLPEGKGIVSTKGRGNVDEESYVARNRSHGVKSDANYPIAVLINRYSASASEIVAAALQDHLRAVIIGERSFGKGSVQNVIAMEGGVSALKLTTASYWRPSGRNIHRFPDSKEEDEWGVKPDKGFEVKLENKERLQYYSWRRERDIIKRPGQDVPKRVRDNLNDDDDGGGEAKPGVGKNEPKNDAKAVEPFRDRVLDKAVDYIRGEIQRRGAAGAAAPPARSIPAPAVNAPFVHPESLPRLQTTMAPPAFGAAVAPRG